MLDVRTEETAARVNPRDALTPSVSVTMWPYVCNLSWLIVLSLFFHSSVSMTAGCNGGGGGGGLCCGDGEL